MLGGWLVKSSRQRFRAWTRLLSALVERSGDDRRHSLADQDVIVLWSSGTTNITVTHRILHISQRGRLSQSMISLPMKARAEKQNLKKG
jgi:hypothetical protein